MLALVREDHVGCTAKFREVDVVEALYPGYTEMGDKTNRTK